MGQIEKCLDEILDVLKAGGGGGGGGGTAGLIVTLTASADGYTGDKSVAEIKSVIDGGGCVYLSYPEGDMRIITEYTDDTSLRIGVFSEDEYIIYKVVDDGNNGVTLTVVSEKGLGGPGVLMISPTMTSMTTGYSDDVTFDEVKQHIISGGTIVINIPTSGIYWFMSNPAIMPMGSGTTGNIISFIAYAYLLDTTSVDGEYTRIDLGSSIAATIISVAASEEHGCTFFQSETHCYIDIQS